MCVALPCGRGELGRLIHERAHAVVRSPILTGLFPAMILPALIGCYLPTPPAAPVSATARGLPPLFTVPPDVQRLAVLYPKTSDRELMDAYIRLEGAAFQLKAQRPSLRIIERFHLATVLDEQRFQLGGAVSEESAIRLGRLLGVDSVLIYRIEGPTLRERLWARHHEDLPPYTVTSKIIRVESAEVVFHNVVTARVEQSDGWSVASADSQDFQRLGRAALERGIAETVANLRLAFQ